MNERGERTGRRQHILTERMKALTANALARKIGYLRIEDFPGSSIFATLPRQQFNPKRVIRIKEGLCLVSGGTVVIRHAHHEYFVKELNPGALFGEMTLLGQTMLAVEAVAGAEGALISFMRADAAREWIESSPVTILENIGSRLASIEAEYYRSSFQLADSRIAALLLELAGENSVIEEVSHEKLGERLGLYRETVTVVLDAMKLDKLIEVGRMRIAILDKRALRELSEL
jgi:CRP-like cAMP-binding protein